MGHDLGVTEALRSLPDLVVVLFAVLTQLGDLWFYFGVLAIAYAFGARLPRVGAALTRERVAFLVALAVGAFAVSYGLKAVFGHPRPPGAETARTIEWIPDALRVLYVDFATASGYSLPSGHAIGSAVVYGGAALVVAYGRRNARYLAAGLVIAVVALSRVIIGVHYLGDVVVGVGVGTAYLALVYVLSGRAAHSKRAFALAVLVALAATAVDFSPNGAGALGGALGGLLGWTVAEGRLREPSSRREATTVAAIAILVGGTFVGVGYGLDTAVASFLGFAFGIATVLVAPLLVEYVPASVSGRGVTTDEGA